ncbi:MAG TPA: ACT domain-containing protein [Hadesarchaea archaeon]|nr:ACT domain-containing protein [Hadesarchaea archaeon]
MTRVVVTVVGEDRVGIVAAISNAIANVGANIEDLTSSRLDDKFVMLVVCDVKGKSFDELKRAVTSAGKRVGMSVVVQREEIFKAMHRV